MYNETKNYKKLKEIYYASGQVTSAISHPRVVGVIKECGGKMWMRESKFSALSTYRADCSSQSNGNARPKISSVPSTIMTKLVLLNESKSSSIWYLHTC